MPTLLKRGLRRAHSGLWYATVALLVLAAVVVGVTSQLLPMAERNPDRVAAWLSDRAGRPVAFDTVQTQWTRRGPLLRLDGLRLGQGAGAISVGEAEILVSMYAGLMPGRSFTELRLRNLDLVLERADDGTWSVRGLPGQAARGDPLANLEGLGELQVIDATLAVLAPSLGWHVQVPEIDLRLRVDGKRVRAGAHAWARSGAEPLRVALDFNRDSGDGRAYARAGQVQLQDWSALLRIAGVSVVGGNGSGQAWGELRAHRVAGLVTDLQLEEVALRGVPAAAGDPAPGLALGQVQGRVQWAGDPDGWHLDVPRLEIGPAGSAQTLQGLSLSRGVQWAVLADQVPAGPVLGALALSDLLEPDLRNWLLRAAAHAQLSQVSLAGNRDGLLRASGRVSELGFGAVDERPGLTGLAGEVIGDADGVALRIDPAAAMRLDWPAGFGSAHDFAAEGELVGWRQAQGWRLQTSGLRLRGDQVGVQLRGGLSLQGDGSRPWLDLAAVVDQAPVTAARGFWVRHRMSEAAVRWLDAALQDGQVQEGHVLVSGDLDDWPFAQGIGRFEAGARISGGRIAFNPEWPAMEKVEAQVGFVGNGFSMAGSGELGGVPVKRFEAGIADFAEAALVVDASASTDAARLLGLVRQSPLADVNRQTVDALEASGPAQVGFALRQPMRKANAGRRSLSGSVTLAGARLADSRSGVVFEDVRGTAQYRAAGFKAEGLQVSSQGQPGVLSLRAGDHARDPGNAFEAELSAVFGVDELLRRAPQLAWLEQKASGQSRWRVGLAVPRAQGGTAGSRLVLRSDLVGTTLDLPAPLDKPAARPLSATVEMTLPLEQGGQVEVALGRLLALRAHGSGAQAGVRIELGTDRVTQAMAQPGLSVQGRTGTLDAMEWVALATSAAGPAGNGQAGAGGSAPGRMALRGVDVSAAQLKLLGAQFAGTRVQVLPAGEGYSVVVSGPSLEGSVQVPAARDAEIRGRFERVHWRSVAGPSAGAPGRGEARPGAREDAFDPASVPPLVLDIDELGFGDARLGTARLRTRPVPGGMEVQQLALRSAGQQIEIKGAWMGTGAAARTRLSAAMESQDLGRLLSDLGFEGRISGGSGSVLLESTWQGGPAAFELAAMQGNLQLDVRDGQLLEVDPGAGRVLGLLSLAQLPRRLSLDFRDLFEQGFAFDSLHGNIGFDEGSASSDDLGMEGPAAEIQIRGSTDLRAQRYDQTIAVQPRSGTLLTVVGAMAGGPLGAAVGAAANAVLARPLGELGTRTYRVTGPWKDPKVEVLSREQSGAQAAGVVPGASR